MSRRRVTILDVAREAGVSVGTVSHVLNDSARVRPHTMRQVEDAIRKLAYRPNAMARSLTALAKRQDAGARLALPRLMSVGSISVDYIARVEVLPHRDDRITAQGISKAVGGPAANVAAAAAALGWPYALDVELATALGDDADSEWAMDTLARRGVHVMPVRRPLLDRLSRCLVIVEANGSRTIINEPFELTAADLAFPLEPEVASRPQCLHLEGYQAETMSEALSSYRGAGWLTSLHGTGLSPALREPDRLGRLLSQLDLVVLNRGLARDVTGEMGEASALVASFGRYLDKVPARGLVILTLDEHGAAVFEPGAPEPVRLKAPAVEVVDATGAGDAFVGVFLACWLSGASPVDAAKRAVVAGSLAVTAEGAQGRLVEAAEIEAWLARPGHAPALLQNPGGSPLTR